MYDKSQVIIIDVLDHGDDRIEVLGTVEEVYPPWAWDEVLEEDAYEEVTIINDDDTEETSRVLKPNAMTVSVLKEGAELNVLRVFGSKVAMESGKKLDYCKDLILSTLPTPEPDPVEPVSLKISG